jgi:hypothetical protein
MAPFKDHDFVARPAELLGRGQSGRAGADDRHPLAGGPHRRLRRDPPLGKGPLGDLVLDVLDQDGLVVDGKRAGRLARGRTNAARDLGKVVGGMEVLARLAPAPAVDEIVELRDPVEDRATRTVAKRDAAVHAPRRLPDEDILALGNRDFQEVSLALQDGAVGHLLTPVLKEACRIHVGTPLRSPA